MDTIIAGTIEGLVNGVVVPIINLVVVPFANAVPLLASAGILLGVFAIAWAVFAVALLRDSTRLDLAWRRLRALPLVVQALAWLLFLPVLAGLWIWRTTWPIAARLVLIAGVAGWNLLVFLPRAA